MHSSKHFFLLVDGGKISKLLSLVISLVLSIVRLLLIFWLAVKTLRKLRDSVVALNASKNDRWNDHN